MAFENSSVMTLDRDANLCEMLVTGALSSPQPITHAYRFPQSSYIVSIPSNSALLQSREGNHLQFWILGKYCSFLKIDSR